MVKSVSKIVSLFKKNSVKRFGLFFALTFVFLIFSKLSNNYKQTIKLKVKLTNVEEEIILNDSSLLLNAYIKADGFSLLPYFFNDTKEIDFNAKKDVSDKKNHFLLDVNKQQFIIENQLGSAYEIITIQPDTLKLYYYKSATKKVPVILNENITYASGFDLKSGFKISPDSVKLIGSEHSIKTINAIETTLLQLKDVNKDIKANVKLKTTNNIEIVPNNVNVNAEVVRFTEGKIDIPVVVNNIPENVTLNYFPKTVTLFYYVDLERYKTISASQFKIECFFNENLGYMTPKLTEQPDFVKRAYIKQKRIDYIKL